MAKLEVKLVKSTIGSIPKHRKTVEALGLKKIGQVAYHQDNPQIRGMINKVSHLVETKEV